MPPRPILVIPDPRLRLVAEPVGAVDDGVRALAAEMLAAMYAAPGIGLAAPQLGVPRRVVVLDLAGKGEPPAPMTLVDPRVTWASDERSAYDEGCLSIPDVYEEVERPARVRVAYLDEAGAAREVEADGLLATCLQHEIDHLDGRLFIDRISRLKRELITRRFAKAAKRGDGPPPKRRDPPARRPPRVLGTAEPGEL